MEQKDIPSEVRKIFSSKKVQESDDPKSAAEKIIRSNKQFSSTQLPDALRYLDQEVGRQHDPISELEIGDLICGYLLIDEFDRGCGRSSEDKPCRYFLARKNSERLFFLKFLKASLDDEFFQNEANILLSLNHPNIVKMHPPETEGGIRFLVSSFLDGVTLGKAFDSNLSVRQFIKLLIPICDAVHHAHELKIIHLDIKPDNVVLEDSDVPTSNQNDTDGIQMSNSRPVLIDFGVARRVTEPSYEAGTPFYMCLEHGEAISGRCCDVFSLGVILYEFLSKGKHPYDVTPDMTRDEVEKCLARDPVSLRERKCKISRSLDSVVMKAVARDSASRYITVLELKKEFSRHVWQRAKQAHGEKVFLYRWLRPLLHPEFIVGFILIGLIWWGWASSVSANKHQSIAANERKNKMLAIEENKKEKRKTQLALEDAKKHKDRAGKLFQIIREDTEKQFDEIDEDRVLQDNDALVIENEIMLKNLHKLQLKLIEIDDSDGTIQTELAGVCLHLGLINSKLGNGKEAIKYLDDCVRYLSSTTQKETIKSNSRLVNARLALSLVSADVDRVKSRQQLNNAIKNQKAIIKIAPTRQEKYVYAVLLSNLAKHQNEPKKAISLLGDAKEILDEINEDTYDFQRTLASVYSELSFQYRESGDIKKELSCGKRAFEIRKQLVTDFPKLDSPNRYLAQSYFDLASTYRTLSQRHPRGNKQAKEESDAMYVESKNFHNQSFAIREKAWRTNSDLKLNRAAYANSLRETAFFEFEEGQQEIALEKLFKAAKIGETVVRDAPANPRYKAELGVTYLNLSIFLYRARRIDEAITASDSACDVHTRLIELDSFNTRKYAALLADCQYRSGTFRLLRASSFEVARNAVRYLEQSVQTWEKLITELKPNKSWLHGQHEAKVNLNKALFQLARKSIEEKKVRLAREAVERRLQVCRDASNSWQYEYWEAAKSFAMLASICEQDDPSNFDAFQDKALELLREAVLSDNSLPVRKLTEESTFQLFSASPEFRELIEHARKNNPPVEK